MKVEVDRDLYAFITTELGKSVNEFLREAVETLYSREYQAFTRRKRRNGLLLCPHCNQSTVTVTRTRKGLKWFCPSCKRTWG